MDVPIHGDYGDLGNLVSGSDRFQCVGSEEIDNMANGSLGTSLGVHGVASFCDILDTSA